MTYLPIADYALLSDCHTAALVSRAGSIDWLCMPRFDKPSIFARLLDDRAGQWAIGPVREMHCSRRCLPGTMLLETTFDTPTGQVILIDVLAMGRNRRGHSRHFVHSLSGA